MIPSSSQILYHCFQRHCSIFHALLSFEAIGKDNELSENVKSPLRRIASFVNLIHLTVDYAQNRLRGDRVSSPVEKF